MEAVLSLEVLSPSLPKSSAGFSWIKVDHKHRRPTSKLIVGLPPSIKGGTLLVKMIRFAPPETLWSFTVFLLQLSPHHPRGTIWLTFRTLVLPSPDPFSSNKWEYSQCCVMPAHSRGSINMYWVNECLLFSCLILTSGNGARGISYLSPQINTILICFPGHMNATGQFPLKPFPLLGCYEGGRSVHYVMTAVSFLSNVYFECQRKCVI